MNRLNRVCGTLLLGALFCYPATITISDSAEYQTIVGFGCHAPSGQCAMLTDTVGGVGVTVNRDWINSDADEGDNEQSSWSDDQAIMAAGGVVIACPWSCPSEYKCCGDSMNAADSSQIADFLVSYVQSFKTGVGKDLYSISPQNEPEYAESYASCQYNAPKYASVIRSLGPKLHALGGSTLIDVCQDMLSGWTVYPNMLKAVCDDTTALKWIDAVSVHGYTNGITPTTGRTAINTWKGLWNYANGGNKLKKKLQVWQTEISGYDTQWEDGGMNTWQGTWVADAPGGLALGTDISVALKYGHVSIWCYWRCNGQPYYSVTDNGVQQASEMFYRYIRPGMVNIVSNQVVADTTLFDVAFRNKTNHQLVVVLTNIGADQKTISLTGTGVPASYTAYRSSANESCASVGTMQADNITLPTHSITTLIGTGYNPVPSAVTVPLRSASQSILKAGESRLYDLNGRISADTQGKAHGLRVQVSCDKNGIVKTGIVVR